MKVNTKKILITILILVVLISNYNLVIADEITFGASSSPMGKISDFNAFEEKEISFLSLHELLAKNNNRISKEKFIKTENMKNLVEIKKFIKYLDLKNAGQEDLEKLLLNEVKNLETQSGYIENYKVYLPIENMMSLDRTLTNPVYYGTYSNHEFREYFSVYTDAYERYSNNTTNHKKWAEGLISFALNFTPRVISIPYTALSIVNRNDIITFGTESIRHDGSDEVTTHYITMQDLYNIIGVGSNQFYVTIVDEARTNTTDSVIDYASPTKPTVVDNISYMLPIYCSTWSNTKNAQMIRGYNQFYYDPGAPIYNIVGRFSIPW